MAFRTIIPEIPDTQITTFTLFNYPPAPVLGVLPNGNASHSIQVHTRITIQQADGKWQAWLQLATRLLPLRLAGGLGIK